MNIDDSQRDALTKLKESFSAAEQAIVEAIAELEARASMQGPDQHECLALADEANHVVARWQNTATVAIEGLSLVEQAIENETKKQHELEKLLAKKEAKLAKMWADSKAIKAAVAILEGEVPDENPDSETNHLNEDNS